MDPLAGLQITTNFGATDWVIVATFFVAATAAGMWAMRFIRNMEDYVVAGRGIRTYLGVASMIAAELGLVTVMYSAQKGFACAFSAFAIAALAAFAGLVVGMTGFIVVPLRRMGVMTIPEYYERRFNRKTRLLGGFILAMSGILNMGMFLKADCMFITSVMGMNSDFALKVSMTIGVLTVLLYTAVGGMIAVVFTDYLQFAVMSVGLVVTSILLLGHFGWNQVMDTVMQIKGPAGFNPLLPESGLGGSYLVWMLFLGFISSCVWQTSVMRATSAENTRVVRRTYIWGSVGFLVRFLVPYFWGICAMVFMWQTAHTRAIFFAPDVSSNVQLRAMPIALSAILPAGFIGLLTAGMLAAAMSTHNTYLHTWSAVLTQDVVAPLTHGKLTNRGRILCARILQCCIAVFLLVWGLWYPLSEALWDYMAVTGSIYFIGAFAVLVGGLYWKRASIAGAYGAFCCGFLMIIGLKPVQHAFGLHLPGSGQYEGLTILVLALTVMVVLSLLKPDRDKGGWEQFGHKGSESQSHGDEVESPKEGE
jgi:SSS family solute:Na+ symporter